MNLKRIIKEEIKDMEWIQDQDPNNTHITDLKPGQVVMVNCPKFTSFKNRKFTVDEIANSARKGEICVHFKEMDKIQYPFGTDREPTIPGMTMCEHLECNFKLIKDINESDMDWIEDIPGDFNIGDKFEYLPSTQHIYPYIVEVTNFVPSINGGIRGINVKVIDLGKNTKSTWDLNNEIYISKRHFSDYLMKPDFMGDLRLKKINESRDDFNWIQDVIEPKVGDKFIHAGMGEYEKARTDYSHYIVNIEDGWIDFKDKSGRFYSSRHEDFLSSHAKNIIREEIDDLEWISDTNPSRSEEKVFRRKHILDNFGTTLTYGNDVKVGDQFLPTNSDTIWTVVNIKKDKDNPSRKHTSYFVRLRDDAGKTRREEWYPQPFTTITKERHKDNGLPGTFPRMNMYKWRKILTKPNLKESNELDWIDEAPGGIEVGLCFKYVHNLTVYTKWNEEARVVEKIISRHYTPNEHSSKVRGEWTQIKHISIKDINPNDYKNTSVYLRNTSTGYILTMNLERMINDLNGGSVIPC